MLKKRITYEDFNEDTRTEDFIFNLTKTEWQEFMLSKPEGLDKYIMKITDGRDGKKIIELFKELVGKAYGEKSDDGRRLVKSDEISKGFFETNAWDVMFQEFVDNPTDIMIEFINGIAPKDTETITKDMLENAIKERNLV